MVHPARQNSATHSLDLNHGRDVTLRNYSISGEDQYGDNCPETTDSPHTVTARVDHVRTPDPDRNARHEGEITADAEIYIAAGTTAATNIRDGGGKCATEIDADGETFVVLRKDVQDSGLLKLDCERE